MVSKKKKKRKKNHTCDPVKMSHSTSVCVSKIKRTVTTLKLLLDWNRKSFSVQIQDEREESRESEHRD